MKKIISPLIIIIMVFVFIIPSFSHADQVHRVANGDTLFLVAEKYGVQMTELIKYNSFIKNPNILFSKQVLIVPEKKSANSYQVQSGDTLYKISQKLGISMDAISEANKLSNMNMLLIGQVLIIPSNESTNYTVKSGDTLFLISQKLGITMTAIMETNKLSNINMLHVGQILKIPKINPAEQTDPVGYQNPLALKYPENFFTKGYSNNRRIALTFDDGPDENHTGQILDVLKTYNAKATFFLIGSKVEQNPDLVKRMIQEGHTIANHTWTHPDMRSLTGDQLHKEMMQTQDSIERVTGLKTAIMRPPYGSANDTVIQQLKDLNYKAIHWTLDTKDWKNPISVDEILINTLPRINGEDSIILMHDSPGDRSSTVKVLPELIETLKNNGFTFVTTDKMLDINPYK